MWLLADGLVSFSDGVCAFFWEMDPVFFGWERVKPLCYVRGKNKPVYVVPIKATSIKTCATVGVWLFVVVKKNKPTAS